MSDRHMVYTTPKPAMALLFSLAAALSPLAMAQAASGKSPYAATDVDTKRETYFAVLRRVDDLDRKAKQEEAAGKNSAPFKEFYRRRLKLTEAEDAALKSVARSCMEAVSKHDRAAKAVIDKFRKDNARVNPAFLGAPPAGLSGLQAARDQAINQHIARLKSDMGSAGISKLEEFIGTAVRVTPLAPRLASSGAGSEAEAARRRLGIAQ